MAKTVQQAELKSRRDQTWGGGGLVVSVWHGDRLVLPDKTSHVKNESTYPFVWEQQR